MKRQKWKYVINVLLAVSCIFYLLVLYYFTIGKSSAVTVNGSVHPANVVPFKTIIEYMSFIAHGGGKRNIAIINLVGNIILTVPLATYIAYFIKPLRKMWKTLLVSAVVILGIEVIQFITGRGSLDIDDAILNSLGVITGYGVWKSKLIQRFTERCQL